MARAEPLGGHRALISSVMSVSSLEQLEQSQISQDVLLLCLSSLSPQTYADVPFKKRHLGFIFFLTFFEVSGGTEDNALTRAEGPARGCHQDHFRSLTEDRDLQSCFCRDQRHRLTLTGGFVSEPQQLTSAPALLTAGTLLCVV